MNTACSQGRTSSRKASCCPPSTRWISSDSSGSTRDLVKANISPPTRRLGAGRAVRLGEADIISLPLAASTVPKPCRHAPQPMCVGCYLALKVTYSPYQIDPECSREILQTRKSYGSRNGTLRTRLEAEVGWIRLSLFRESRIKQCGGVLKYWSHPLHQC